MSITAWDTVLDYSKHYRISRADDRGFHMEDPPPFSPIRQPFKIKSNLLQSLKISKISIWMELAGIGSILLLTGTVWGTLGGGG